MTISYKNYMNSYIDLHIHTNHSADGSFSIQKIIKLAEDAELKAIAITDHDTVTALLEYYLMEEKSTSVKIIPGIELTVSENGYDEIHLLGYGINPYEPSLTKSLSEIQNKKLINSINLIRMLNRRNIPISLDEIKSKGYTVSGFAVEQLLKEKKLWDQVIYQHPDVFNNDGSIRLQKQIITIEQAITIINQAGGKAFLAHPCTIFPDIKRQEKFIEKYAAKGLWGIECYNSINRTNPDYQLIQIAEKLGLRICGGSDFHGEAKPEVKVGIGKGNIKIPYEILEQMHIDD